MKRKIAVIEDDEVICDILTRVLEGQGYQVAEFTSPQDFLLERAWEGCNAIVSDVAMPGFNGLELGMLLRSNGFTGPLIYITGGVGALTVEVQDRLFPLQVLRKPFRSADVLSRLSMMLGAPPAAQ